MRAILAVAAVVLLVGLAQTGPAQALLRDAGVTGEPERYTELAFAYPDRLPDRLAAYGRVPDAAFTVRNLEGERRTFRWRMTAGADGRTSTIARGAVQVASGARAFLNPQPALRCVADERVRVSVRLADPDRAIGFWARCRR